MESVINCSVNRGPDCRVVHATNHVMNRVSNRGVNRNIDYTINRVTNRFTGRDTNICMDRATNRIANRNINRGMDYIDRINHAGHADIAILRSVRVIPLESPPLIVLTTLH